MHCSSLKHSNVSFYGSINFEWIIRSLQWSHSFTELCIHKDIFFIPYKARWNGKLSELKPCLTKLCGGLTLMMSLMSNQHKARKMVGLTVSGISQDHYIVSTLGTIFQVKVQGWEHPCYINMLVHLALSTLDWWLYFRVLGRRLLGATWCQELYLSIGEFNQINNQNGSLWSNLSCIVIICVFPPLGKGEELRWKIDIGKPVWME